MTEIVAESSVKEVTMDLSVRRAVPCDSHVTWTKGCPNCLTGEQAFLAGVEQETEERHVRWDEETEGRERWRKVAKLLSRN